MRKLLGAAVVLVAAAAIAITLALPPARLTLPKPSTDGTVAGVLHVHSSRSDGRGTIDDIARAAAQAGLQFVVITDHGDATDAPGAPTYRSGVLCLSGVEISTTGGHYVAIDMPAAPYPLGGEARDVVDDVKRLGGFGIVAHPDSPKPELRWREWTAPFDGIELVNPDTSWRQWAAAPSWRQKLRLVRTLLTYPVRPAEAIASLIQPSGALYQWNALAARRKVVTVAGADAHARVALRSGDPAAGGLSLPLPSYIASFRALSVRVRPDRPLSGDATTDASIIMRAIRAGHLYSAIDGAASPPMFEFTATNSLGTVHEGDQLGDAGPLSLRIRSNAPAGFETIVWNGTKAIASRQSEPETTVQVADEPGVYWAEIRATDRSPALTWVRSNPIYVRRPDAAGRMPQRPPATTSRSLLDASSAANWRVEHDPDSLAAAEQVPGMTGMELRVRFGLGASTAKGQFAALVFDVPEGLASSDRLALRARAERPMRVSVQLRTTDSRWRRSIYLDTFNEDRTIYFDDLTPVGATATWKPPLANVRSVLLVIDATNTKPGSSGRLWIAQAALQR